MKRAQVVDDIKKFAPTSLKVTLRDGTDKAVAVPKAGNRWSRTQQVLDSLAWVSIECLDKDGRVLGVLEDEDADDEDVDGEYVDDDDRSVRAMARIMMEVQRCTMKECRQQFQGVMDGMSKLMTAMADGQQQLVESYKLALTATRQIALAPPGGGDDNAEMMNMLQMAMFLKSGQAPAPKPGGGQ